MNHDLTSHIFMDLLTISAVSSFYEVGLKLNQKVVGMSCNLYYTPVDTS